ncbi:type II toxin-antitoxin system VapC family toxin [Amycolatopsis endophytica]|uniref:Ribonuclease VapC n=1 Tax=Amycolatopsis endophytica TaxID=860233 RepID=A0A853AYF8_9PSEU|nr:type II toxin-antitoxin system VapC family toxin [Amycolatopsis endophytica]NYI87669.1 hypothetical protein [Amycolatopsis endophytica]
MRVYLDTSALIKRVIVEQGSEQLVDEIDRYHERNALLVSSSLAWVEVSRALRVRGDLDFAEVADEVDAALSGVAEHPIGSEVVSLGRHLNPNQSRSLDAIHLASALMLDVDVLVTYDDRLAGAARHNGLRVRTPR